jgi:(p)ppGpp synthase/HD superfamily hydrolase
MNMITLKARRFAIEAHGTQQYGPLPYIVHLEAVVNVLIRFGIKDQELQAVAYLHDTLEDTNYNYTELIATFGSRIVETVYRVTSEAGKNRKERFAATYPKIKGDRDATIIKLADRIANVENCLQYNMGLLAMYTKEFPAFMAGIWEPTEDVTLYAMWSHLKSLMWNAIEHLEAE